MATEYASAIPRKRFFVEMFTRDIALEDCILDLVDNSVDALIRRDGINLQQGILPQVGVPQQPVEGMIDVRLGLAEVVVTDNCGGIDIHKARTEIFNFGHSPKGADDLTLRGIGAYGVGLKRAIFKIGRQFEVISAHNGITFRVRQDLETWLNKDDEIEDWRFPLEQTTADLVDSKRGGTRVNISRLLPPITVLLSQSYFTENLFRSIARTYAPFLGRYVRLTLNGRDVEPDGIPLGYNSEIGIAKDTYEDDGVTVSLVAGLATRGPRDEWAMERAGWYVLCNGRVVMSADKSELTGWGGDILPRFHSSKGRGFVGIASFASQDPLKLPWTTTKRGLNQESPVFMRARNRMQSVARPVYSHIESLYPSGSEVTSAERDAMKGMQQADLATIFGQASMVFTPRRKRRPSDVASVQYKVKKTEIDAVREHLESPKMSNGEIGTHTFRYFLSQEGLE